jgi:hypothetical protein
MKGYEVYSLAKTPFNALFNFIIPERSNVKTSYSNYYLGQWFLAVFWVPYLLLSPSDSN